MPFESEKQRKAMYAAASGKSNIGIPEKVAKKFIKHSEDAQNSDVNNLDWLKSVLLIEMIKGDDIPDEPTLLSTPEFKKDSETWETKEGKKELLMVAKEHEAVRDHAMRQDPWFDYAEGALQIAIVLLSVSIVAGLPLLFWAGTCLGALSALSALNGFFLFL